MKNIDLTPIFQAVITLLAALITYRLIPYIKTKMTEQQYANLTAAARVAVYAAEQIYKSGDNQQKLDYAMARLLSAGFSLDAETIRAAVEHAVYSLKPGQLIAAESGQIGEE